MLCQAVSSIKMPKNRLVKFGIRLYSIISAPHKDEIILASETDIRMYAPAKEIDANLFLPLCFIMPFILTAL